MQKSSLAPTPSISYALHDFGRPEHEFQALLYYVPFFPVNLVNFGGVRGYVGSITDVDWNPLAFPCKFVIGSRSL